MRENGQHFFLLTSGSWHFRVEKCCAQFWHTFFFKLLFSQKQRRPFFYRYLYQLLFTCGERCEKKLSFFSSPGIVIRFQILLFLLIFVITLQTFLTSFETSSFNIIFSNIISIVVVVFKCTFSKSLFFLVWIVLFVLLFLFHKFQSNTNKVFCLSRYTNLFFPMINWLFWAMVLFSSFSLPAKIAIINH